MRTTGARWLGPVVVLLLVLPLAGCSTVADFFRSSDVLDTGIEPVDLEYAGPTYAALVDGRLVVRDGDDAVRMRGYAADWLPNGRALVGQRRTTVLVDPAEGELADRRLWDPSRAVTQVNSLAGYGAPRLRTFDLDLS